MNTQTFPVVRFVFGGQNASAAAGSGRPYTVVYDGVCKVCNRLVGVLDKWDSEKLLEAVPFQNTGVQARFPWIPAASYTEAVQLIGPGGQTWQGAAAIEQLLAILPKGALLSWAFKVPLMDGLIDRFYRWFARNRYRLGCGEHCQFRPLEVSYGEAAE